MRRDMRDRWMVALDVEDQARALALRDCLGDCVGWFKIGLRLFVAEGPQLVQAIGERHKVFLDLKFHDIPNTVAQAVQSAGELGVDMLNVHAAGGMQMLKAAADAARAYPDMLLVAVTVLTSDLMPGNEAAELARERALMAREAGLDGVVCSVWEAGGIKQACGDDFLTVTPGIRWGDKDAQDQKRIADPRTAIEAGSDYLIVGRPVIEADDPRAAALEVLAMMRGDAQA